MLALALHLCFPGTAALVPLAGPVRINAPRVRPITMLDEQQLEYTAQLARLPTQKIALLKQKVEVEKQLAELKQQLD